MKNIITLFVTIIAVFLISGTVLMFIGCSEDNESTTGPGETDVSSCGACHNISTDILAMKIQYEASVHANGGNFERNSTSCAPCHTSEGFREVLATGFDVTADVINNPTPPNCRTCHNLHTNYDSSDYALASVAPIQLIINGETVDIGNGNLCVNCHQPRKPSPLPSVGGEDITITSSYWGPHHSTQASIFAGAGGYEISGSVQYESSVHGALIDDGCITCHMADAYGSQAGGHTMNMAYDYHGSSVPNTAGCNSASCHPGLSSFDYNGAQTEIKSLLDELKNLLVENNIVDDTDHPVVGKVSVDKAGALMNYLMIINDGSYGVHNPGYTKALLQNSIEVF